MFLWGGAIFLGGPPAATAREEGPDPGQGRDLGTIFQKIVPKDLRKDGKSMICADSHTGRSLWDYLKNSLRRLAVKEEGGDSSRANPLIVKPQPNHTLAMSMVHFYEYRHQLHTNS